MFRKHENCHILFKEADQTGFKELVRRQVSRNWSGHKPISFHEDPGRLWNDPLIVGWKVRHGREMVTVEKQALTQARTSGVRQTAVPAVTASDQVSVVLEPDEGKYQGVAAAAQPDGPGHGGRAKFAKRGWTFSASGNG